METTTHPKTGRPIAQSLDPQVGDLVSEGINGDSYPAVVVARTPKTCWVRKIDYVIGNVSENDVPGWNGYGDSATLVVDPESVAQALAQGRTGATAYRLYVTGEVSGSLADQDEFGGTHHRTSWKRDARSWFHLSAGATYRRNPHV